MSTKIGNICFCEKCDIFFYFYTFPFFPLGVKFFGSFSNFFEGISQFFRNFSILFRILLEGDLLTSFVLPLDDKSSSISLISGEIHQVMQDELLVEGSYSESESEKFIS